MVERFVGVHPGKGCPPVMAASSGSSKSAVAPTPKPSLRGTLWRLQALQGEDGPKLIAPPGQPVELQLDAESGRVSGSGGCNRLIGGFQLSGELLSFSKLAGTKMACPPPVMDFERRYNTALGQVRRWSLDKQNLLLQNEQGRTLLLFKPAPSER